MAFQFTFLADFTAALVFAWAGGALAARLRVNPILGYVAAGIAIGPFTPGYVARGETIDGLATVGLIFLLFSLGLGFSFEEIRRLGGTSLVGNGVVMTVIVGAAALVTHALGFPHPLTIGLTTAVSSTAVGVALLRAWGVEERTPGRFAVAHQVVQDLVAVALLVVTTTPAADLTPAGVGIPVLKAVGFVGVALVLGATVLHWLVRRTLTHAEPDRLIIAFGALAMAAAWLGNLVGLSYEFGAFVAGAVISEAAGSRRVASVVAPFRALFVTLFFVSVGMLLDIRATERLAPVIVGFGGAFVALRFGLWSLLARVSRLRARSIAFSALAMTALGEFNVVLIDEAAHAKRLDALEQQLLLGITVFSIVLTVLAAPLVTRFVPAGPACRSPEPKPGAAS